jgi:hypothetical protein
MAIIPCYSNETAALAGLARLITERFGDRVAATCEALDIRKIDCPHEVGGGRGVLIIAAPNGVLPNSDNIAAVYFGDTPPHLQGPIE